MTKKVLTKPVYGKMDSFHGDRSVVMSKKQLEAIKNNPKIAGLYLSSIGFYPHAKNHFRKRKKGIEAHILIYCIDGYGGIETNNQMYDLSPNTLFVIPAHQAHSYWASQDSPWSIFWIHFAGNISDNFKDQFGIVKSITQSSRSRKNDRIRLFNEVLTVLESGFTNDIMEFSNLYLNSLLASFFYTETYCTAHGFQSSGPIDRTIFFMQRNIDKSLKISDFAKNVNLSESHLSKIFRNKTGSSPIEYFINLKMQEAIRLLSNQSLRTKEVAYKLGYSDPFYFSRLFTKHIGSTPSSFQKNK
jgi:AraC family transcriptional regulator of arabinose operon